MQEPIVIVKPKKRINSKRKGKRGELGFRNVLHEAGYVNAYRSQQYCGSNDSADVICPELPSLHFEVKVGNKVPGKLYDFMGQAKQDCGTNTPVLAVKRDNCEWLIILRPTDFFSIVSESDRIKTVFCPLCRSTNVARHGTTDKLKQRYRCSNPACNRHTFVI